MIADDATVDPILVTIYQKRLENIAEQMSIVLRKTAYSSNIKERADYSVAIFDKNAQLLAQAEAIPVHLGSMSFVAHPILEKYSDIWQDGDAIIVNSPQAEFGGTHLPDITLIMPVFNNNSLQYILACRAHHADVGGSVPGSLPAQSTEVFQEGIIIPPVKLFIAGAENADVMDLILANVRTPHERRGDLRAQYASLQLGKTQMLSLLQDEDWDFPVLGETLLAWSDKGTRAKLKAILPTASAEFTDYLDSDGISDDPVKIHCRVSYADNLIFDFTGSAPQQKGNVNAPLSITTAAVSYVVRLLTGRDIPTNAGCFQSVQIIAPKGSVVNPHATAATSSANTETSQRIVDVVMGAVGQLVDFPAASQGTMNNTLIGGIEATHPWTIYETIGGGSGASSTQNGTSAIHSHMTNTENTPIEALELTYPIIVRQYSIRKHSGGSGDFNGGDGITRSLEVLHPAILSIQSERRKFQPWGKNNAESGTCGANYIVRAGERIKLPGRVTVDLFEHDIVEINTPGGGGYLRS